jgi:hypothetical protein
MRVSESVPRIMLNGCILKRSDGADIC